MEAHIIDIIRFGICGMGVILSLFLMYKADDNHIMRRVSALLGAALVFFNNEIGKAAYLAIGAILELWFSLMGLGFILIAGIVIMLLPLLWVISWLTK